jgi:hypothetical protein
MRNNQLMGMTGQHTYLYIYQPIPLPIKLIDGTTNEINQE